MERYMTIGEAAEKWNITGSMISRMCREARIPRARKADGKWEIPADAEYPSPARGSGGGNGGHKRPMSRKKLPLPIGISDYRKASTAYYYVDKTLMIRDFLDDMPQVSLFTRPRRFGKTLNMDMLRTFFEKTEEDTSVYFTDKAIW